MLWEENCGKFKKWADASSSHAKIRKVYFLPERNLSPSVIIIKKLFLRHFFLILYAPSAAKNVSLSSRFFKTGPAITSEIHSQKKACNARVRYNILNHRWLVSAGRVCLAHLWGVSERALPSFTLPLPHRFLVWPRFKFCAAVSLTLRKRKNQRTSRQNFSRGHVWPLFG